MLSIDALKAFGADTGEGMARCLNNEAFYLRLVKKVLAEPSFDRLREAVEKNDLQEAFEAAHALKGVLGNLSLTPIYTPVSEMTELLRAKAEADYQGYVETILAKREELQAICGD